MKIVGTPREEPRPVPQGSCQSELHRALERLAASQSRTHEDLFIIPIPNCDRNGNFHPKQCHPALDGQRGSAGVWIGDRGELPGGLDPRGSWTATSWLTASKSETCQQVGDSVPPTRPLCSGVVELTWLGV